MANANPLLVVNNRVNLNRPVERAEGKNMKDKP